MRLYTVTFKCKRGDKTNSLVAIIASTVEPNWFVEGFAEWFKDNPSPTVTIVPYDPVAMVNAGMGG